MNGSMNNRYKLAFSGVRPSDDLNERILAMTEKKKRVNYKRVLALTAAVILILAIFCISVNAATNGEFFTSIKMRFNGELQTPDKVKKTYDTASGNTVEERIYILGDGAEFFVRTETKGKEEVATADAFGFRMEVPDTTEAEE